jgi:hypothetical protein
MQTRAGDEKQKAPAVKACHGTPQEPGAFTFCAFDKYGAVIKAGNIKAE